MQHGRPVEELRDEQAWCLLLDIRSDACPSAAQGTGVGAHLQMAHHCGDLFSVSGRHAFDSALFQENSGLFENSWPWPAFVQLPVAQEVHLDVSAAD
ncbi:hypothetical protein AMK10_23940 [Streptomyces sp. CB02058]|nr:hypothetical protein AMK10_23940 [Streptomyces sp. CB02058]